MSHMTRLENFRTAMDARGWRGAFLTPSGDLQYLTGLRRQRPHNTEGHMHGDWLHGVLITADRCLALCPLLAEHHVRDQVVNAPWIDDLRVIAEGESLGAVVASLETEFRLAGQTLGVPRKAMAQTVIELQRMLPDLRFELTAAILAPMRAIKDEEELALMQAAARIADQIFADILPELTLGMTEWEIGHRVEALMNEYDTDGPSFVTGIMIKGAGADPRLEGVNRASATTLAPGRVLAFDFGVIHQGYVSDFGRTVYCGEPDAELLRYHTLVHQAQQAAMEGMRPSGITAEETDALARSVIEEAGLGPQFFHRLGHGIGIDVHEAPFLARGNQTPLEENMSFTVEPSLLIPERGFVRVEDVVVVTPTGGQSLNQASHDVHVIE